MKKTIIAVLGIIVTLSLINSSCTNNKASVTAPSCDTTTVRLSVELESILSANCYSCHGGNADGAEGIKLQDYATIKSLALNGDLINAVAHTGSVTPMPKDAAKLSDCDINKFKAWVNRGAQNN